MSVNEPSACSCVFVYGTLQQGECRARHWPHPPQSVTPATARGQLFDLGAFPAMVEGDDIVAGELWRLAESHIAATLRVLDMVEAAAGKSGNLYDRRLVSVELAEGERLSAWSYFHANPEEIAHRRRIEPDKQGVCRWRAKP